MLGYLEYVSKAWEIYKKNSKILLKYSLFIALIPAVFNSVINLVPSFSLSRLIIFLLTILSAFLPYLFSIPAYQTVHKLVNADKPLSFKEQFLLGLKRFWPVIFLTIILVVIITAGIILLIIPGIIFAVWYFASMYIAVNEDVTPMIALDKSKKLVTGRWWTVVGYLFVIGLIVGIPALLASALLGYIITLIGADAYSATISSAVIGFVLVPLEYLIIGLLYNDLKKTRSGESNGSETIS